MEFDAHNIHRFATLEALFDAAARRWAALADEAVQRHGGFHVALSGGSTPKGLYQRLAQDELRRSVAWDRVHLYFGDERCVPPGHIDSNYRMVRETLLEHLTSPPAQVHRMRGEDADREAGAAAYAQLLAACLPHDRDGTPCFDLVMLGLGPDGHVASLFPHTAALQERGRWVTPVHVAQLNAWRLSITLPVIDAARHIMLLAAGEAKAPVVREVLDGRARPPRFPVEMIRPRGSMEWYLDEAAAPSPWPETATP